MKLTKCPICGGELQRYGHKQEDFEYQGRKIWLEITTWKCKICQEEFFDDDEMHIYTPLLKHWFEVVVQLKKLENQGGSNE